MDARMEEVLISGLVLGLAAGFSPGPLMALVVAQTLQHGTREGLKTALVPLITDLPVIALSLVSTAQASRLDSLLGIISLAGGLFVVYLAWESFHPAPMTPTGQPTAARTWRKGIFTNLLSPNPWLFWFTAGAAALSKGMTLGWHVAALFLLVFYVLLCGTKAGLALVVGRSRSFLNGATYHRILGALGVVLLLFALVLFRDALRFLGVLPS